MAEIITKDRKEYNIWDKVNSVWNRLNFLTNAKSVDADDGKNLETKVGAINGISSSSTATSNNIAASIGYVNSSISGVNTNLKNLIIIKEYTKTISSPIAPGWNSFGELQVQIPDGYHYVACMRVDSDQTGILIQPIYVSPSSDGSFLTMSCNGFNVSDGNIDSTVLRYYIIFIKNI